MKPDEDGVIHFRDKRKCLACSLGEGYPKVHTHQIWAPPQRSAGTTIRGEADRGEAAPQHAFPVGTR